MTTGNEQEVDETAAFITTNSDVPVVESKEEGSQENQVDSDNDSENTDTGDQTEENSETNSSETETEKDLDSGSDQKPEKKDKQSGVQKRINKVVREREEERRKNETLKKKNEALEKRLEGKKKEVASEPVETDFDTYDEYLNALEVFDKDQPPEVEKEKEVEKPDGEKDEDPDPGDGDNPLSDSQKTSMAILKETIDGAEKPSDFDTVALNKDVPITGDMIEALAECEDPAKVMYHLGKNVDLASEISGKSPAQQMREITKLDITVTPKKPVKQTSAPDPINPGGGKDAQKKAHSEMSFSEYEAEMNEKERKSKKW